MPLVRLDKVSVNFGTHILLDEVEFTRKKGSNSEKRLSLTSTGKIRYELKAPYRNGQDDNFAK